MFRSSHSFLNRYQKSLIVSTHPERASSKSGGTIAGLGEIQGMWFHSAFYMALEDVLTGFEMLDIKDLNKVTA